MVASHNYDSSSNIGENESPSTIRESKSTSTIGGNELTSTIRESKSTSTIGRNELTSTIRESKSTSTIGETESHERERTKNGHRGLDHVAHQEKVQSESDGTVEVPLSDSDDTFEVSFDGDDDPFNPRSMNQARKWILLVVVCFGSLCV